MTDEGMRGNPVDAVEMTHDMKNIAKSVRAFYEGLVEAGFNRKDSMVFTVEYVRGLFNMFRQQEN